MKRRRITVIFILAMILLLSSCKRKQGSVMVFDNTGEGLVFKEASASDAEAQESETTGE